MKKFKSILSLGLAAAMAVSILAGCGKADTGDDASQNTSSQSAIPSDVKLKYYTKNYISNEVKNMGDIQAIQEIQKETGVQVEYIHPATGVDEAESFNLMIASNQLPDIIFMEWASLPGGITRYLTSNTILKLNDLIDKNGLNYKAVLDKNPECKKSVTLDDGTMPGFYKLSPDQRTQAFAGFALRGDWLEKLKLQPPVTIDDWHTVLTAFKTQDPNGNGKADEIPWTQSKEDGTSYRNFAEAYGLLSAFYIDPASGNIKFGPTEPAYKDFLATMASWYKEGLIDPDFATNDANAFNSKWKGDIGGSSFLGGIGGPIGTAIQEVRPKIPSFKPLGVSNPVGKDGKSYSTMSPLVEKASSGAATITKECKYPEAAAKYLDYFYSEKGSALINFGIEGETYTVQDGKKVFTDKIMKDPGGKAPLTVIGNYAVPTQAIAKVMDYDAWSQFILLYPEQKQASSLWAKEDTTLLLPSGLQFTADESSQNSSIMNDVNTYMKEEELKIILGSSPVSNWDSVVSKVKAMDIDQVVKNYQNAYDRFKSR